MKALYKSEHSSFKPVIAATNYASNNPLFLVERLRRLANAIELDNQITIVLESK